MYKYLFGFTLIILFPSFLKAQNISFEVQNQINILMQSGVVLPNAFAGGINAGQFSSLKINEDAIEDLIVFDKTSNKLSVFIAVPQNGAYSYRYAPQYESLFPEMVYWCLAVDYNADGRKDLFSYSTKGGIKVHRNSTVSGQNISFELVADPINTQGFSGTINLLIPATDIPSFTDMDGDGDLDIITFEFFSGSLIEYHQNQSIEKYGNANTLEFKRISNCWGGFFEGTNCGEFTFNINCRSEQKTFFGGGGNEAYKTLHVGSTILVTDLNGDGKKDILVGDVSCNNLYRLINQGTNAAPLFNNYDTNFPESKPIAFSIFPAVFLEDFDFDGKKDLIAAPNVFRNEANLLDFQKSAWFYKNTGTNTNPVYQHQKDDFLQSTMVDLGENAFPALADYDADGDLDLFVGSKGRLQNPGNTIQGSVTVFKNTGTKQNASFQLADNDFLNLSALEYSELKPSFKDINQDGIMDFTFTANVNNQSKYFYILNQSTQGQTFLLNKNNIQPYNAPLEPFDTPYLFDLNRDGKLDLLLGKSYGSLSYYENKGTNLNPDFSLVTDTLGGISEYPFRRNLCVEVADEDFDNKLDLITTDNSGVLSVYPDFTKSLSDTFNIQKDLIVDTIQRKYIPKKFGSILFFTSADLDGDSFPELVLGTGAGGLFYLKNTSRENIFPDQTNGNDLLIYPNPGKDLMYVKSSFDANLTLFSADGKVIVSGESVKSGVDKTISLQSFNAGVYILKAVGQNGEKVEKRFIVER